MNLLGGQMAAPPAAVDRDLEQVLLGLADGSYVLSTPDGAVAESGVGVAGLLGAPAESLVGRPIADVLVAGTDEPARARLDEALRAPTTDPSARHTFSARCAGGATRSLQLVVVSVPLALGWEFTSLLTELRSRDATWRPEELRLRHSRALEAVEGVVVRGTQPDPGARLAGILIVVRDVDAPPLTHQDVERRMSEQRAAVRAAAAEAARRLDEAAGRLSADAGAGEESTDPAAHAPGLEDLVERARVLRERVEDAERDAAAATQERDDALARLAETEAERDAALAAAAGVQDAEGRFQHLAGERDQAQARLQDAAHELHAARQDAETARAAAATAQTELAGARAEAGAGRADVESARAELGSARAETQAAQAEAHAAAASAEASQAEARAALADAHAARDELGALRAQAASVGGSAADAAAQAEAAHAEAASARADAESARAEAQSARAEAQSAHADAERLRAELLATREAIHDERAAHSESAGTELAALRAEAEAAHAEAEAFRAELTTARAELGVVRGENALARGEASAVRAQLQGTHQDLHGAREQLDAARAELQARTSALHEKDAELQTLPSQLRQVRDAQLHTHAAELLERDEALHAARVYIDDHDVQLADAVAQLASAHGAFDAMGAELEAARAELEAGAAELERTRDEIEVALAAADDVRAEREQARLRAQQLMNEAEQARAAAEAIRAEFAFDPIDDRAPQGGPPAQRTPWSVPAPSSPTATAADAAAGEPRPELPAVGPGEAAALIALDGSFKRLDDAFCSLLGCREEDLRAARWPSIIDRENLKAHGEIARALKAGEIQSADVETVYMHAQGLLVPIEGTVSMHRAQPGGPPTHFLFRADVSRTAGVR